MPRQQSPGFRYYQLEIQNQKNSLTELQNTVNSFSSADVTNEDQGDLIENAITRYLVVRSCGYIEYALRNSICYYLSQRTTPEVTNFIENKIFKGQNPKPDFIERSLSFLPEKRSRFVSFISNVDLGDGKNFSEGDLKSLVSYRNKIAHGESENIAKRKSIDFANLAIAVGDWFISEFFSTQDQQ